jgi:phosphatidylglycerophosphatase A
MKAVEKLIMLVASGFNAGYISIAPGTFGAVLGLPICFFLSKMDLLPGLLAVSAFTLFAIWVAGRAQTISGIDDPGCIVIDEVSGLMVALLGLPFSLFYTILGFTFFRLFDIFKPFPIRYLEKKFSGGLGIVIDDVAAGVYSNLLIRIVFIIKEGDLIR